MKYYLGVDGGGTKTLVALFDENGKMLDSVKTGGSNHENLPGSFPEAADIIFGAVSELLKKNSLSVEEVSGCLMGLAGIDHPYQHDALYKELYDRGLRRFDVLNDGFIITFAGLPDGVGIGYNCGTGTCCNSIGSDGRMLQIGGFEALSGDMGNGHWIATSVFRAVYDDVCLAAGRTAMTDVLAGKLCADLDRDSLLSLIPKLDTEEGEELIRMLIDVFFDVLNAGGDAAADGICETMAVRGAKFICAHLRKQRFDGESVRVVLSGSIHTKLPSGKYLDALRAECEKRSDGKKLDFIILDKPPVTGCVNKLLKDSAL
ncbi:MAG: hypothetical protein K6G71_01935 [Clostridiales bacterium]|nr:hypothetical protein [Clostridiales bacterium]